MNIPKVSKIEMAKVIYSYSKNLKELPSSNHPEVLGIMKLKKDWLRGMYKLIKGDSQK